MSFDIDSGENENIWWTRGHITQYKEDLLNLWKKMKDPDIQITINGDSSSTTTLPAHKCVLSARSPIFSAIFDAEDGNRLTMIEIRDLKEKTVKRLLEYLYTGQIEDVDWTRTEEIVELVKAAHKFEVLTLKEEVATQLSVHLTVDNFARVVVVLRNYFPPGKFRTELQSFYMTNMDDLRKNDNFKKIAANYPSIFVDLLLSKET